jgi:hypothetical protein
MDMVIIARSRDDNGCWTIRGRMVLDLAQRESFSPILRGRLINSRGVSAFRSRRRGLGANLILRELSQDVCSDVLSLL